jgi:hypothetical protein
MLRSSHRFDRIARSRAPRYLNFAIQENGVRGAGFEHAQMRLFWTGFRRDIHAIGFESRDEIMIRLWR